MERRGLFIMEEERVGDLGDEALAPSRRTSVVSMKG